MLGKVSGFKIFFALIHMVHACVINSDCFPCKWMDVSIV
jgi:hypothetical protein